MNPINNLSWFISLLLQKKMIVVAQFALVCIVYAADEEKKIDLSSNDTEISSITVNNTSHSSDSVDIYNVEETQSAFQVRTKDNGVGYYGMMYSESERIRGLQEEDELKVGIGINIQF